MCSSDLYAATRYVLVAPNDELAARQRTTLSAHAAVEFVVGDFTKLAALVTGPFELIVCDEALGNLETLSVRRIMRQADADLDDEEAEAAASKNKETFIGEGDSVQAIFKFGLSLDDAPDDFFLNTGSFRLMKEASSLLAPGGQLYLVEFGELYRYPVRTSEEGGFAFSQHFGLLTQVAKRLGFQTQFGYLMDELEFVRNHEMLATTRSQFKALRFALGERGVALDRRAYTREEFEPLLEQAGLTGELLGIVYEPLEERVLGLVMHAFKLFRMFKTVEL